MSFGIPPPEKPESPPPPDYWGWFVFHLQQTSGGAIGEWIAVGFIFGWPGFALYAGYKGLLTGRGFWGGALYSVLPIVAVAALVVVPIVTLNMIAAVVIERGKQAAHRAAVAKYQKDLAEWKAALQRWEEGAPARDASARLAAKKAHHASILKSLIAAYHEGAKGAATRRAALEAQLGEIFRQYRLRNDWDASDPALVPRLQAAFRKWMQEMPPFPPEDMALLAMTTRAETRALLPAPSASAP